jgi:hypothetical protein
VIRGGLGVDTEGRVGCGMLRYGGVLESNDGMIGCLRQRCMRCVPAGERE